MSESIKTCIAVFLLSLSQGAAESQPAAPDLVLLNGKIFTSDAGHPYVQALAIRGERITATGDSAKIRALVGPHTKRIDLGGRTVIPGINDAHDHLGISPPNRIDLEFKNPDPVWPEMKDAIAAAVLKAPKGTFIYGRDSLEDFSRSCSKSRHPGPGGSQQPGHSVYLHKPCLDREQCSSGANWNSREST